MKFEITSVLTHDQDNGLKFPRISFVEIDFDHIVSVSKLIELIDSGLSFWVYDRRAPSQDAQTVHRVHAAHGTLQYLREDRLDDATDLLVQLPSIQNNATTRKYLFA